jgi:hypothetical protein
MLIKSMIITVNGVSNIAGLPVTLLQFGYQVISSYQNCVKDLSFACFEESSADQGKML